MSRRPLAPGTLVLIDWIDAAGGANDGWVEAETVRTDTEPYRCRTVGWVQADDGRQLVVASSVHPDEREPERVASTFHLPHAYVTKLTVLRKP